MSSWCRTEPKFSYQRHLPFYCELNESRACVMYKGIMGIRFYKLNDKLRNWLDDNNIKYKYRGKRSTLKRNNPVIIFYDYKDLIAFKLWYS